MGNDAKLPPPFGVTKVPAGSQAPTKLDVELPPPWMVKFVEGLNAKFDDRFSQFELRVEERFSQLDVSVEILLDDKKHTGSRLARVEKLSDEWQSWKAGASGHPARELVAVNDAQTADIASLRKAYEEGNTDLKRFILEQARSPAGQKAIGAGWGVLIALFGYLTYFFAAHAR